MFDWIAFFDLNGIEYVTSGPNVGRDHAAIKCVWCGHADPSQHLVVNLLGPGFRCWRNQNHRGRDPALLVQTLLGCSFDAARRIVYKNVGIPADALNKVKAMLTAEKAKINAVALDWPHTFKPLSDADPACRPFLRYLRRRGFDDPARLSTLYDLAYCSQGDYRGRVIFPVYHDWRLMTWTARSILPTSTLRYMTLSAEQSVRAVGKCLLWYDDLKDTDAHTIILCEGPFDALKVNVLGYSRGVCATCFFTSSPSDYQIGLLADLLPRFKQRILLLDQGMFPNALRVMARLRSQVQVMHLPKGVKDPGELQDLDQLGLQ